MVSVGVFVIVTVVAAISDEKRDGEPIEGHLKSAFSVFGFLSLIIFLLMVNMTVCLVKQIKAANKRLYGDSSGQ